MHLANTDINALINQATQADIDANLSKQIIPLLDLTSLNADDNEQTIQQLCTRAQTKLGDVAAVCVYPPFVKLAKEMLAATAIKVATVANFPEGNNQVSAVIKTIEKAIEQGAHEIDVVIPYHVFLKGDEAHVQAFVFACKEMCSNNVLLKVILETGALQQTDLIYKASRLCIDSGANFLKTSTGKINVGATLEAAAYMLLAILDSNTTVGLKVSGGIRTTIQANSYLKLAELMINKAWITANHFRIGASSLLNIDNES